MKEIVEKNFIDDFVKENIRKGITIIYHTAQGSHPGKRMCYYTGQLQKDILDNFPGRTSKKIFKSYKELLEDKTLIFTQKRFDNESYDYYVQKINA